MEKVFNELLDYFEQYIVKDENVDGNYDKDRCLYAWKNFYNIAYAKGKFVEGDVSPKEIGGNYGWCLELDESYISGDVLFNFKSKNDTKEKNRNQKYELYEKILKQDFDGGILKYYLFLLKFCNYMNYSFHNMGLMPTVGYLQCVKESFNDRLDSFCYVLDDYFKKNTNSSKQLQEHLIFSHISRSGRPPSNICKEKLEEIKENRKIEQKKNLIEFLNRFGSEEQIYLFCKEMYLINDRDFVDELIDNGKNKIEKGDDVVKYMQLAIKYWLMKDRYIRMKADSDAEKVFINTIGKK